MSGKNKFDLDCLFVHAPKADNHYLPLGDFFNITYLPMGLFAIAELLRRHGFRIEVVHLGVEWLVDPAADLVAELDGQRIRAIGLSLYWHYQSFDAIEAARALKAAHPEAFVFLGGVTASYFAGEILEKFPFIDAVVRGHAEGSALHLIDALREGRDPGQVAGVVVRGADASAHSLTAKALAGRPASGPSVAGGASSLPGGASSLPGGASSLPGGASSLPGGASSLPLPSLDDLVFADLSVLRHHDTYVRSFGFPLAYSRELSPAENRATLSMGRSFFPLFTGRGCPYLCTFCGGNRDTLRGINGTSKVAWRAHDRVLDDIRRAMDFGYRTMSLCFDPTPTRDDYYVELFRKIRAAGLEVDFYFECWGLPTRRFVEEFRRTFPSPESYVALSPDAGDETVRERNKQPHYTDDELFGALDLLREQEVTVDVFFTLALPFETVKEAMTTAHLKRRIAEGYRNARRVMTWTVQLEPGSPQFERPSAFRMVTDRHCFEDFYRAHGGDRADTYSSLGFKIDGYFGDARDEGTIADFERHLQHLKCMEFCFLAKDPRQWNAPAAGRRHCLERRQGLAGRRGHALPSIEIGPGVYYEDALLEERTLRGERPRHRWLPEPK